MFIRVKKWQTNFGRKNILFDSAECLNNKLILRSYFATIFISYDISK